MLKSLTNILAFVFYVYAAGLFISLCLNELGVLQFSYAGAVYVAGLWFSFVFSVSLAIRLSERE